MKNAEALVIGAGAVGLLAALCLAEHDVQVHVLDAAGRHPVRGYACGLHAGTLTLLREVGLLSQALGLGHRVDRIAVYRGPERIGTVDLGRLAGPHRYALSLRQSDLEDLLIEALEQRGVQVSWHHEVTQLTLAEASVNVTAISRRKRAGGEAAPAREMVARQLDTQNVDYVIGADGYHSVCRRALGIDLLGAQRPEVFAVCEFLADLSGWEHEARLVLSDDSVNAFWPLGPRLGRWTFQVQNRLHEDPSLTSLREWIRERARWFAPNPEQLCWGALAEFPKRVARRFGSGRIWLAGDSAHSTGPLGFQSLNRGLCEARELAAVIRDSCQGRGRRVRRFEQFDRQQQSEWRRLFDSSTRLGSGALLASDEAARIVPCLPASGSDLDALLAQLGSARVSPQPSSTMKQRHARC